MNILNGYSKIMSETCLTNLKSRLSIVIPVLNEGIRLCKSIPEIDHCLSSLKSKYDIEFWLVDDGSKDNTWQVIQKLSQQYPEVNGLRFTRNFGKEAAIMAGLTASTGQATVVMDSDLQHPPALIPQMVKLWESGFKIISTRKVNGDPRSIFYQIFKIGRAHV